MNHNIKYSKDLLWMKPFVDEIANRVDLSKIKAIKSYKVKKGYKAKQYGATIREGGKFTITLLCYRYIGKKQYGETLTILLDTLAHELAHVAQTRKNFGNHDYKHFRKQALILLSFSYILKRLNINDTSIRFNNLV